MSTNDLKIYLVAQLVQGVVEGATACWKLLEPGGPLVDESVMTIDGVRFWGPTVPAQEH